MTWVVIALDDLKPFLVAGQVDALNTAALGAGQANRFDDVMPKVASRVRAKVASCQRNILSATANSVPPELESQTCWLILEAMQAGLTGLELTEGQKAMVKKAEGDLERVADCKDVVSKPDDPLSPDPEQRSGSVEVVTSTTRKATSKTLEGF